MRLQTEPFGDGVLVMRYQANSIDASNAVDFRDALCGSLNQATNIVLDMAPLQFIDSAGLGALVSCLHEAHRHNGELLLAAVSQSVRTLMELMRMEGIFSIHPSVEEAVKSCPGSNASR